MEIPRIVLSNHRISLPDEPGCVIDRYTKHRMGRDTSKELPRIPAVKTYADFRAFSQAGRELAHWHLEYETVACHPGVVVEEGKMADAATGDRRYRVTKMKFGITNDANLWATETMANPKYPLELFLRVVTVGLETMKVVDGLPALNL